VASTKQQKAIRKFVFNRLSALAVDSIAEVIKIPVDVWPGNCHGIALAIEKAQLFDGARSAYGFYYGPISRLSIFYGRSMARHGWLHFDDVIIDPTRWVFEAVNPYIYVGPDNDDYDLGMAAMRAKFRIPFAQMDKGSDYVIPELLRPIIRALTGDETLVSVSRMQLGWIANLSPMEMPAHGKDVYQWIIDEGRRALIPIDFYDYYFRDSAVAK